MPQRDQPVSLRVKDSEQVAVSALVDVLDLQTARPGVRRIQPGRER
jgi:hypothetical protein